MQSGSQHSPAPWWLRALGAVVLVVRLRAGYGVADLGFRVRRPARAVAISSVVVGLLHSLNPNATVSYVAATASLAHSPPPDSAMNYRSRSQHSTVRSG
ncbi:MAG: hypothetical protein L0I76_12205 [Pseudonocardia sp.]|nr:hypothetical protein [Pseudonocardia sp.]